MFGPIFTRELVTAGRRNRLHTLRVVYVGVLLLLVTTAWQMLTGTQVVRSTGELARFSSAVFQILTAVQFVVIGLGAGLSAALSVAHEKDRRTLVLLLMTRVTSYELVVGKWLASVLVALSLWLAALPLLLLCALLGGVGFDQIVRSQLVTAASIVAASAMGATFGFWREKTVQSLSLTALVLILASGVVELASRAGLADSGDTTLGRGAIAGLSPWHALVQAARPALAGDDLAVRFYSALGSCAASTLAALAACALTVWRVRAWNTASEACAPREAVEGQAVEGQAIEAGDRAAQPAAARAVWDNPILWREMRTWAYGRRILLARVLYVGLFVVTALSIARLVAEPGQRTRFELAMPLAPLVILSLTLINAQAVTSLTSERDAQALDLLLVTDVTSREFIFGKLGGALWNAKEMVLLPVVLLVYLSAVGNLRGENLFFLTAGWAIVCAFAAVLGFHCGMQHVRSRLAIGVSLATLLFLVVGIATTIRILVAFSGSFAFQLQPFLATIVGGGVGLYLALGGRNPSPATFAAAFFCPIATFYALTSFLLGHTLAVFLAVATAYGFNVAAMLIPAIYEFDVATGRGNEGAD